jgi:hypothetical protein
MPQQIRIEPGLFHERISGSNEDEVGCVGRHSGRAWGDPLTPAPQIVGADDDPCEQVLLTTGDPLSRSERTGFEGGWVTFELVDDEVNNFLR